MGSRVVESLVNSGTLVGRGDRSQLLFDIFLDPPRPEISLDFAEDVTDNQSVSKSNVCVRKMFNGEDFLKKFRGKNFMFVGDSLSNNQWQSLACMLHASVPNSTYTFVITRNRSVLSFPEFEFTVTFLKDGFLVDLLVEEAGRVIKLDSLSRSEQWKGVDFLIFNSYHWWIHTGRLQTWDYFQVGDKLYKEMNHMEAYKIALTTWANWIDSSVDPAVTKVFFQGISAVHYQSISLGATTNLSSSDFTGSSRAMTCVMLHDGNPLGQSSLDSSSLCYRKNIAIEELWLSCFAYHTVLPKGGMLQECRVAGTSKGEAYSSISSSRRSVRFYEASKHSSLSLINQEGCRMRDVSCIGLSLLIPRYYGQDWNEPTAKDCSGQTKPIEGSTYPGERYAGEAVVKSVLSNMTKPVNLLDIALLTQLRKDGHPARFAGGATDCSHWCVAGVPDAWNELLYAMLLQK
ncbi:Protein trichome birefringence-like 42 [Capsicum chinense]|nr:Protein trichome birefringence-like 42 [Capsicum chinense]